MSEKRAMKKVIAVLLGALLVLALFVPTGAMAKKKGAVYEPPYKKGPSGGDEWNDVESNPEEGSVRVIRVFPGFSPVVGCAPEPAAGWSTLHVVHKADGSEKSVIAKFSEASLDSYAWITVAAFRGKNDWLGARKLQGPIMDESGTMKLPLVEPVRKNDKLTVEFGVQLGDSCPQVSFAEATFPTIKIL